MLITTILVGKLSLSSNFIIVFIWRNLILSDIIKRQEKGYLRDSPKICLLISL